MKRTLTILISLLVTVALNAQHYTIEFNNDVSSVQEKPAVNSENPILNFSYPGVNIIEVNTENGIYNQLIVPNTYRSGSIGNPQLISSHKLIEIPNNCNVSVNVIDYNSNEYSINNYFVDNKLIPYQPSYSKNDNIEDIKLVVNSKAYSSNEYNKNEIASIKILGTLRGTRIAKISINPVEYNPSLNSIKFYNNIKVEIICTYSKSTSAPLKGLNSPYFNQSFAKIETILPSTKYDDHPDLVKQPVKYLIVTPSNYLTELEEFIKWKTQKGFQVVIGNLEKIGSSAAEIKTWVHNQYLNATDEDPAPSFLLLVGDVEQIPASQIGQNTNRVTDLYYASVDGDMFPDMYYGRIPAQDTIQLSGMLAKILMYEKYQFTDDTFLNDVTLIAGADGTWNPRVGQPTVNYGTNFYFNATNGFTNVNSYLTSYTNCYSTEKVGVSMINYTAHCSQTSWSSPYLGTSGANAFTNTGKYPVAIGNCCTSGDFNIDECIGEAWIRNPEGGAIAYLGSVPDTYWWEDFYWAVGAHDPVYNQYPLADSSSLGVYDAPFKSNYHTVDAMVFVGNLAVTEAHNEGFDSDINSLYYWEAYHCLGDPSLVPYLTQGTTNSVIHESSFPYKVNTFQVEASPGSLVAISNNNGLIGTSITDTNSIATIQTDTLTVIDSIQIVITKPQHKPYVTKIPMGQVKGTYLIVETASINDTLGNSNGIFDFGEESNIQLTIKNIGDQTAKNILLSIESSDQYLEYFINNLKITIDSIPANNSVTVTDKFNAKIKDSIPDGYQVSFNVELSDSLPTNERDYYNSKINKTINAPILKILQYKFLDDFASNGNGVIDYGETATLQLAIINEGHTQVSSTLILSNISVDKALSISTSQIDLEEFALNDTILVDFNISLPQNANVKSADTLQLSISRGKFFTETEFTINLGQALFAEIGTDNISVNSYPLNNYWKNNSTQILYLKNEIGEDAKVLNSIALDISLFTPNIIYRDLNNFKIEAIFTDLNKLTSAADFTNSQLLYSNSLYTIPDKTGWEKFILQQPLILSDNKNIIIQISWGQTDNYTEESISAVNCTKTSFKSVAWGANDNISPAPIDNVSLNRPNTQFEFDSVGVINITVQGDLPINNNTLIENCEVSINSETKLSDEQGRTQFYFTEYSGDYTINFSAYGYIDTSIVLHKTQTYSNINVILKRNPQLALTVKNGIGIPVLDATVTIGENIYHTNSQGLILSYSSAINSYAVYSINKTGYTTVTDSVYIDIENKSATQIIFKNYADITFQAQNSLNEPIADVEVIFGTQSKITNGNGLVTFVDFINGKYLVQLYNANYKYIADSIDLSIDDTTIVYTLKTIGNVNININNGSNTLPNIDVVLGNLKQTTNSNGETTFNTIEEGKYLLSVNDNNYYSYSDSVNIFGKETDISIELTNRADVEFYIHNGFTGIENAKIEFNALTIYSDTTGYALFENIDNANYKFTISAEGYYPISDFIDITFTDTVLNIKLNFIPDLKLQLIATDIPINNIPIVVENDTLLTDEYGAIEITDIGFGTYNYSIEGNGFYSITDSVTIVNDNVAKNILIQSIPDVKFIITNGESALSNVKVILDNNTLYTNNLGEVIFTDLPKDEYDYSIEKDGYINQTGLVNIGDNDTTLQINLIKEIILLPYDVKFIVSDNSGTIEGANIAFNNKTMSTNSIGEVIFTNTMSNTYLPYVIWKSETHVIDTGFVNLVSDTTINITLIKVGINDKEYEINIYPNPTNGILYIESDNYLIGSTYMVLNSDGRVIAKGTINDKPQKINLNSNPQGIYFINIITNGKTTTHSIVLE